MQDLADDTTPQLGGNLDVNGQSIVSASAGNILITPDTTGKIVLDGLSWPTSDGTADQVLKTDGVGQLSFGTGGSATVVDRTQMPTSSSVVYLFDDFLGSTPDFTRMATSGSYWEHCLANSGDDFCGATRWRANAALYGRGIIQVMPPYSSAAAGQEWLWQLRVKIIPHPSETILGMNVSAFCPKSDLNDQTTEQGSGYGDTAKAGLTMRQDLTYW